MIKRRFYRLEHGSRDAPSESSSSSDSEVEAEDTDETEAEEEEEEDEENVVAEVREKEDASSSSGYESEDSSVNEVNLDSSGLPTSEDEVAAEHNGQNIVRNPTSGECDTVLSKTQHSPKKDVIQFDETGCVLKFKSVFKCKLCPRIVCLSEETMKAHLNSKRHTRSVKLHKEGRLKLMLNDDGQLEGETQPEKNAMATDPRQELPESKKKGKGRWKPKKRLRQKERGSEKARLPAENREKRRKKDS